MAGDEAAPSMLGEPGPFGGRAWEGIIRAYSEFFPVSAKTPVARPSLVPSSRSVGCGGQLDPRS